MPNPNHIAFISPRFPEGATVGGAETLLKNLAARAQAAGGRVTFLTTCAENHFTWENTLPPGRSEVDGLTVERFPVNTDRDLGAFLKVQEAISRNARVSETEERLWMDNNVNSNALYEHLEKEGDQYDRILTGPYLFGLVFKAAQIHPDKTWLVPCLHDEAFAYLSIMRELFDAVAGFCFNTEPERDLAKRLFTIPEKKCSIVGMGLDPFDVEPDAFKKTHGLRQPYILYCGRREPLKGTPLLVDYFRTFRERNPSHDLKLVFTGSGDIAAPPELAPHILDLGFVSEQEKHEVMAGASAFVHPSVNESLGIVLLEAWLAGTPGLVHDRCEVLRWQCQSSSGGLWFRNYPEFEQQLLGILENPEFRQKLGRSGQSYVKTHYAWPEVERRMFEAIA